MRNTIFQVDNFCPHLGMIDDRASSYAYPNGQNACYAVEPACPVRLEQQANTCLSGRYKTCSLYHFRVRPNGGRTALPLEVLARALVVRRGPRLPRWQLASVAVLTIAALLAAWLALPALRSAAAMFVSLASPSAPSPLPPSPSPPHEAALPISSPGPSVTSPPSSVPLTPSPSPTLPVSPSPVSEAAPPVSSCPRPSSWLAYTIRQGDTLFQLSRLTGTTVAEVLQANCLQSGTLLSIGQVVYLPRRPASVGQPTAPRPTSPPASTLAPSPPPPPAGPPPTATSMPATATLAPSPPPPPTDPPPPANTAPPPTPRPTPTSAPTLEG